MNRIRVERPKVRNERGYDPLPLDPRDPDILRAKQFVYVGGSSVTPSMKGRQSS